jgi:hypothetical protein
VKRSPDTPILTQPDENGLSMEKLSKKAGREAFSEVIREDRQKRIGNLRKIRLLEKFGIPKTVLFGGSHGTGIGKFMAFLEQLEKRNLKDNPDLIMGLLGGIV